MLIVSVMYIGFSFSHADRIIAGYNIANTESMNQEDVCYLIYGLSDDAAPEIAKLSEKNLENLGMLRTWITILRGSVRNTRNMSVRSWNFSGSSALDAAVSWQEKRE